MNTNNKTQNQEVQNEIIKATVITKLRNFLHNESYGDLLEDYAYGQQELLFLSEGGNEFGTRRLNGTLFQYGQLLAILKELEAIKD